MLATRYSLLATRYSLLPAATAPRREMPASLVTRHSPLVTRSGFGVWSLELRPEGARLAAGSLSLGPLVLCLVPSVRPFPFVLPRLRLRDFRQEWMRG
jgi:hypothetical protein